MSDEVRKCENVVVKVRGKLKERTLVRFLNSTSTPSLPSPASFFTFKMSTTPTQLSAKYRGAVVEVSLSLFLHLHEGRALLLRFADLRFPFPLQDLQLPPALSLGLHTQVVEALSLAYDREFSRLP